MRHRILYISIATQLIELAPKLAVPVGDWVRVAGLM